MKAGDRQGHSDSLRGDVCTLKYCELSNLATTQQAYIYYIKREGHSDTQTLRGDIESQTSREPGGKGAQIAQTA